MSQFGLFTLLFLLASCEELQEPHGVEDSQDGGQEGVREEHKEHISDNSAFSEVNGDLAEASVEDDNFREESCEGCVNKGCNCELLCDTDVEACVGALLLIRCEPSNRQTEEVVDSTDDDRGNITESFDDVVIKVTFTYFFLIYII